jgi:peroxiredoxin
MRAKKMLFHHKFTLCLLFSLLSFSAFAAESTRPAVKLTFKNKEFDYWVAQANNDFDGFRDAVESWGLDALPQWVALLSPATPSSRRHAALLALEMLLRDNGLQSVRKTAAMDVVPALLSIVRTERGIFPTRAINTLRAIGPGATAAVPDLLAIVRDPVDPDGGRFSLRSVATLALGQIQEPGDKILPALAAALADTDPQVRRSALSALQTLSWRAISSTNQIELALAKNTDPTFRQAAEKALTEIRRPRPLLVGDSLPDIELAKLSDQQTRHLRDFKGRMLVIDFWSSLCPPCQPAMDHLNEVAKKRKDGRVAFVGISEDETVPIAQAHASRRNWQNLELLFDSGGKVHELFRSGLPEMIVIDASGTIVQRGHPAEIDLQKEMERWLTPETTPTPKPVTP